MYYNCYEIMCINKYRLWDHTEKITWFHMLARNTIFPFFAVTRSPATLSQQTMVLSCRTNPGPKSSPGDVLENGCITDSRPGLMSHQHLYNSFFHFCSRCRRLLCNYHLVFLTRLSLTLESAREPDCHPDTRIDTCKLGCLLPRKQSFQTL